MNTSLLKTALGMDAGFPRGFVCVFESSDEITPLTKIEDEAELMGSVIERLPVTVCQLSELSFGELLSIHSQCVSTLSLWRTTVEHQKARHTRNFIRNDPKGGEWKARAKVDSHPTLMLLNMEVSLWEGVAGLVAELYRTRATLGKLTDL